MAKKPVRQKKKFFLSKVINKGKTHKNASGKNHRQVIGNLSSRLRSANTTPNIILPQACKRITFATPISATRTFSNASRPSQISDDTAKLTLRSTKKHGQVQEQRKPILRSSVRFHKPEDPGEREPETVTMKMEIIDAITATPSLRVMRSGVAANTEAFPPLKPRSHEMNASLHLSLASIKKKPSSPDQSAQQDTHKSVTEIYRMVTRSGRQVQDIKQERSKVLLKPIKQELDNLQEYENSQPLSVKSVKSLTTPSLRRSERQVKPVLTAPSSRFTRKYMNWLVKTEPVKEEEPTKPAVESTRSQEEVKIVRKKNPRKLKAVQVDLTPKVPRRTRATDVFPMDDVSKKYFPCPVPFCDQRFTDRTTRNYHLRNVHPSYEYKNGDGWEKIREQRLFDKRPDAMTEAAVAPGGASDSRPTSPDSPPHNAPSPPAVVPNSATQGKKTGGSSAAQRQNEALAFAKFLVAEEQRLRKLAPQLTAKEIEKMITQKWMSLKPTQRLQYLIKKEPDALSFDQKQMLKKKLDEQLDSRIKDELAQVTPQLSTSVPSPGPIRLRISKAAIEAARSAQVKKEPSAKKSKTPKKKQTVTFYDFPEIDPFDPSVEQVQSIVGRAPIQEERLKLVAMEQNLTGNRQLSNFQALTKHASSYQDPRNSLNTGARDALHLYYMALCEPAFPRPGDRPLTEHRAEHYWEQYLNLSRL